MSTWATVAAATALGATEGDAGGAAVGALVEGAAVDTAPVEPVGFAVVVTTTAGCGAVCSTAAALL
jgi:hypothetical protein